MEASSQLLNLSGHHCVITGGGGHLGAAMVRTLARLDAKVVAAGRNLETVARVADELRAEGRDVSALALDVTSDESVSRAAGEIEAICQGRVHAIVNNAYAGPAGTLWEQGPADYLAAVDVVVGGAVRLLQGLRPLVEAAGAERGASIVNIASMYGSVSPRPALYEGGFEAYHNPPAYGVAKAGLIQWTKYCAAHLPPYGIRCNAITPGPFPRVSVCQDSPGFQERLEASTPAGRIGVPEDLAGAVAFLISGASSYVNGATLPVDGGWTAV